jgi:hypothetical protein
MRPVEVPQAPIDASPEQASVPFRQATTERVQRLALVTGQVLAGSQQSIQNTIDGSGYMYGVDLFVNAPVTDNNVAVVAYNEDAPYNALSSVILNDVNGEVLNLTGFELYLANLVNRDYAVNAATLSADAYINALVTGAVPTGGTFRFPLRVPVGINRRDLTGILGNQDRSQQYTLRTDLAPSTAVYATPPDVTLPTPQIQRFYESYSVPMATSPAGQPQQQLPDTYGTIRMTTSSQFEAAPLGGSTVNHYVRRIGQTVRWHALVFRINGGRAAVESDANRPTNIAFRVGDETIFNESYAYRRARMFEQFGFDFPAGVLVYAFDQDFTGAAGYEMGDDYLHTQLVQNMQYEITYPAGFGSTGNSLVLITDDMMSRTPSRAAA